MKKLLVLFLLVSCNILGEDPLCRNKAKLSKQEFQRGCFIGSKFFIEYAINRQIPQEHQLEIMNLCERFYTDTTKLEI